MSAGRVALGSDHGGFEAKEFLKKYLQTLGYTVLDVGTDSKDSVDYPDFALKVARKVSSQECERGIMIDGAGIGSCMVCNKVKGIRAALCYDQRTAMNSREHNNANVLTLGGPLHSADQLAAIVKTWLETDFAGGRHWARVNKIMAVERG
jgi:ribose 5-phosphate isomerase B